jgi:hypothetical protein
MVFWYLMQRSFMACRLMIRVLSEAGPSGLDRSGMAEASIRPEVAGYDIAAWRKRNCFRIGDKVEILSKLYSWTETKSNSEKNIGTCF